MARSAFKGRIRFDVEYSQVERNLKTSVWTIGLGAKKGLIQACQEIGRMTLAQVPEDTGTLASSFFYELEEDLFSYVAAIGYGKDDLVNPKTKQPVSQYMIAVHEDLDAYHPKGKAKFLEDPVREYQQRFLSHTGRVIRTVLR